jgi:ATP adenylyltransferase
MEYLHAYWRMDYIEKTTHDKSGNPFVALPQNQDDAATYLLWRGPSAYLVMNTYPYTGGHLLAVPYREVPDLQALQPQERSDLMETVVRGQRILQEGLRPHGFNIGMNLGSAAGAGIPRHLHIHIVPRWHGDTNFMPIVGQTRVLSKCLSTLWERLRAISDSLDAWPGSTAGAPALG